MGCIWVMLSFEMSRFTKDYAGVRDRGGGVRSGKVMMV